MLISPIKFIKYCYISNPLNTICPITLEEFNIYDDVIVLTHCNHIFKTTRIIDWLYTRNNCPFCRDYISTDNTILQQFVQNNCIQIKSV